MSAGNKNSLEIGEISNEEEFFGFSLQLVADRSHGGSSIASWLLVWEAAL